LLGGDTISAPARVLGLTAIGRAAGPVPSRTGARPGDQLWVSGTIGDAGAGLKALRGELARSDALIERYRNPRPRLEAGQRLAGVVSAMMDVSDGLLIDAHRLAAASACGIDLALDAVPLSEAYLAACGAARLEAATAGDDYELLFTASPDAAPRLLALADALGLPLTRIGATSGCRKSPPPSRKARRPICAASTPSIAIVGVVIITSMQVLRASPGNERMQARGFADRPIYDHRHRRHRGRGPRLPDRRGAVGRGPASSA
jgi:hypothetical protein